MYKSVYLKKGKEESLKRFHPWIFSGAIQTMDEGIGEGDIVRVFTRSGEFIAIGHYQIGSIAVRVLSFRDIEIGEEYMCSKGFEPPTHGLEGRCSIQLSYEHI